MTKIFKTAETFYQNLYKSTFYLLIFDNINLNKMPHIPIELYIEQLKFLPGNEVYRCKLVSREWNLLIENCQAILPIAPVSF